jgi:hypothetical protein
MAMTTEERALERMGKNFPIAQIKTFDLQMIMIIIASNRPQGRLDNSEVLGRLLDYLLIRLITVFDPDFFRVFFLVLRFVSIFLGATGFLVLLGVARFGCCVLQANEESVVSTMARIIAKRSGNRSGSFAFKDSMRKIIGN